MTKETKSAEKKPTEKKQKVELSQDQLDNFKAAIRAKVKDYDITKVISSAKKLGVDVSKYSKLSGGLQKMSITNSMVGNAVAMVKAGSSFNAVLKSI